MSAPFARANALFVLMNSAIKEGIFAPSDFNYSSRGHGMARYSGKKRGNESGKVYPFYSKRECERRVRQMNKNKVA